VDNGRLLLDTLGSWRVADVRSRAWTARLRWCACQGTGLGASGDSRFWSTGGAGLKGAVCTGKPNEALSRHPPTNE
jgi:hypothetical protein